jgi:hypothetical protein
MPAPLSWPAQPLYALAFLVGLLLVPSSAQARAGGWSDAYKVSPIGDAQGAELDNNGVLRVWWQNKAEAIPRFGVSLTTRSGQMKPAKLSALDSFTDQPVGINPAYQEPVFLRDGRALRCAITVNRPRTLAHITMLVYSHSGQLIKRVPVASQVEDTTALVQLAPTCQMAAAGEQAVIEFTQQTPSTNRYQGNRQIYVARVLPGLEVTTPVPILASGETQQAFIPGYMTEQVSLSASGWAAVAWAQADVTRETPSYLDQRWQFYMRWLSPTGTVGPAIALGPMQAGRWCPRMPSLKCGLPPAVPAVEVAGSERALVVFGAPRLMSEEVSSTGDITALKIVSPEEAFTSPESNQVASGGGRVVVTWGGGYDTHGCKSIHAVQWRRGRWGRSVVVGRPVPKKCLFDLTVHTNEHGQASVIWFHQISGYLGFMQGVVNV